jgi:hypothetical protein
VKMKEDMSCCNANSHHRKCLKEDTETVKITVIWGLSDIDSDFICFKIVLQYGGQNNGNTKKLKNRICVAYTETYSICLYSVVLVLSNSLCEIIRKMESCAILIRDRSLVRIYLEHL